jgi:hypothetical protein
MPFSLIPTVLGVSFALVWLFIGGMILRDGQFAVRRERELGFGNRRSGPATSPPRPHVHFGAGRRFARDHAPTVLR